MYVIHRNVTPKQDVLQTQRTRECKHIYVTHKWDLHINVMYANV